MTQPELFPHAEISRLSPEYFLEVERRCDAASPGPWIIERGPFSGRNWLLASIMLGNSSADGEDYWVHITTDDVHASELYGDSGTDAEFISHARTDLPNLLRAYREAQALISALRDRLASESRR
jgi:hypothetical protein